MNTRNGLKKNTMVTLGFIKKYVENEFNIKDISKKTRKKEYISARAIYYKLSKEETSASLSKIGSFIDKNHATVLHGLNSIFPSLEIYDRKAYNVYVKYKEIDENDKIILDVIKFDDLKIKYALLKRDNYNLERRYNRLCKIKENNKLFEITDKFNELTEDKQEIFKTRVNAILKMI